MKPAEMTDTQWDELDARTRRLIGNRTSAQKSYYKNLEKNRAYKREWMRKWRSENLEKARAQDRAWVAKQPRERFLAMRRKTSKAYNDRHADRRKQSAAKYRAANLSKVRAQSREWAAKDRAVNPERTRAALRKYCKKNAAELTDSYIRDLINNRFKHRRVSSGLGRMSADVVEDLIPIVRTQLQIERIKKQLRSLTKKALQTL